MGGLIYHENRASATQRFGAAAGNLLGLGRQIPVRPFSLPSLSKGQARENFVFPRKDAKRRIKGLAGLDDRLPSGPCGERG